MAKNTTLGRKSSTGATKNEGYYAPSAKQDQSGDGADFAFNGQMGDGVNGHGTNGRHSGNHSGLTMKENYGMAQAARRGNASDSIQERREHTGPSVTKDPLKKTISTAGQGHNIGKHEGVKGFKNPDAINVGMK